MADAPIGKEFVFKMPNGTVVGRAKNLHDLVNLIKTAPLEAVLYHGKGAHFGSWLAMLGEHKTAQALKGLVINDKTARVQLLRAMRP